MVVSGEMRGESTTCVSEKLLMTLQIWEDEKLDSHKKFTLKSPTRIKLEKKVTSQ